LKLEASMFNTVPGMRKREIFLSSFLHA